MSRPDVQDVVHVLRAWLEANWPGLTPRSLTIRFFDNNQQIRLPLFGVPPPQPDAGRQQGQRG